MSAICEIMNINADFWIFVNASQPIFEKTLKHKYKKKKKSF